MTTVTETEEVVRFREWTDQQVLANWIRQHIRELQFELCIAQRQERAAHERYAEALDLMQRDARGVEAA